MYLRLNVHLVVLTALVIQTLVIESSDCRFLVEQHDLGFGGFCGNTVYDSILDNDGNDSGLRGYKKGNFVPSNFKKQKMRRKKFPRSDNLLQRLARDLVVIRLNIVYDSSLAEEYKEAGEIESHVKGLIYATQLVFEQPEMLSNIRFNLVVVSLKPSRIKLTSDMTAVRVLESFGRGPDLEPAEKADLNILMLFRNMWNREKGSQMKILGLANLGTFCAGGIYARPESKVLLINAGNLGASYTLAHEIGHSLNCVHDGSTRGSDNVERLCSSDSHIMSPSMGPKKLTWSPCTISCIQNYFLYDQVSRCVYDPVRLEKSQPYKPMFDFTPRSDNQNRKPLPGEERSIDAQCAKSFDRTSSSALTRLGRNGGISFSTCQNLVCLLGGSIEAVGIGPAPSGSACQLRDSNTLGYCFNGDCNQRN